MRFILSQKPRSLPKSSDFLNPPVSRSTMPAWCSRALCLKHVSMNAYASTPSRYRWEPCRKTFQFSSHLKIVDQLMVNDRNHLYWKPETLRQACQTRTSMIPITMSLQILSSPVDSLARAKACKGNVLLFEGPFNLGVQANLPALGAFSLNNK